MTAVQTTSAQTVYNISTTGHGDYDRSWEDYIDYSRDKGIVFDSHDYTYGIPEYRKNIKPVCELPSELVEDVRKAIIKELTNIGRIFQPSMWIGSSSHYNFNLPCKVVRSRKFRGDATLIGIAAKKDIYGRECYKALIVGSNKLKYYVSPNCIQIDNEVIISIVNKLSIAELADVLDECHYGHWNFHPYNRHLFSFPRMLEKYAPREGMIDTRSCKWAWMAEETKKEQSVMAE